jgi:hypothetical protein
VFSSVAIRVDNLGKRYRISGSRDLSESRNRNGGSSLRLMSFDVVDSNGESMVNIPCGKSIVIEIMFQSFVSEVKNLRFGISFFDKSTGIRVTELNSYYGAGEILACKQGIYKFAFIVNRMPLAPGQYSLTFIVTSGLEILDWIRDAYQLAVSDGAFYESGQMPLPESNPAFFIESKCKLSNSKINI